jgi:OOP family OmpA-OmpF porin
MHKIFTLIAVGIAALGVSNPAVAQKMGVAQIADSEGYFYDDKGQVIRDPDGRCIRSAQWSFRNAIEECDPHAVIAGLNSAPTEAAVGDLNLVVSSKETRDVLVGDQQFAFDDDALTDAAKARLDTMGRIHQQILLEKVVIRGHTDRLGDENYNRALGLRRGEAVKAYLVSLGIPAEAITIESLGSSEPLVLCTRETGEALKGCLEPNRRTEIIYSHPEIRGALLADLLEVRETQTEVGVKLTRQYLDVTNQLNLLWRNVGNSCRTELTEFCNATVPGEGRVIQCLYEHYTKLNPACESDLDATQLYVTSTVFKYRQVAEYCALDIATTCKDILPGTGGLMSCLIAREEQLHRKRPVNLPLLASLSA